MLAGSRLHSDRMCTILASQGAWRDLMDWLLRFVVNLNEIHAILENDELKIIELYPEDVARLCTSGIENVLDKYQTSRHDYCAAAAMLNQMKSLGLGSQATEEAKMLREIYANRPALLEELRDI